MNVPDPHEKIKGSSSPLAANLLLSVAASILVPATAAAGLDALATLGEQCRKIRATIDCTSHAFASMVASWPEGVRPAPDEILGAIAYYAAAPASLDAPPEKKESKLNQYVRRDKELIASFACYHDPIIDGLLRRGETLNLIAAPKVGKSWLVNYLAYAIANGQPWLGKTCSLQNVLILDNELHEATAARRLDSVKASLIESGMELRSDYNLHVMSLRGINADIDGMAKELILYMQNESIGVLVLDALYRMLPDGCSENDNTMMMRIYNKIDAISKHTGAAVIVIHHTSKGDQTNKGITDIGAGAGSISRAADAMIALRPHEQEGLICMHMTARSWPPESHLPMVIRRNGIAWEVCDWANPAEQKGADMSRRKNGPAPLTEEELLKVITEKPLPIEYFKGVTKASHDSILAILEVFIELGTVICVKSGNRKEYALAEYQSKQQRAAAPPSDDEDIFGRELSAEWIREILKASVDPCDLKKIISETNKPRASVQRLLGLMVRGEVVAKQVGGNGELLYSLVEEIAATEGEE